MVRVINSTPDASVVKQKVCRNCGVTLEYTPNDVQTKRSVDYTGHVEFDRFVKCPSCHKEVYV
jgi:uncharacterized protein with PIN domain